MALAATIFWYVAWRVVKPVDPSGPISLLLVDQGVICMAQLLGLAIVSSGLAVAICGAGAADRGPLAVAVGLAALGLRGSQLDMLVMYRIHLSSTSRVVVDPFPATALIAECWLWLALIAVGFVVGRWVANWFAPASGSASPAGAVHDRRGMGGHASDVRQGLSAVIVASFVAWAVLTFTIGSDKDPILKGQMYFSVGVSFLAAGLVAHWFFRGSSRVWSLILVAVVASAAYFLGAPDAKAIERARETGVYLVLKPIARPLPIEFAALGALGALWERDWMRLFRAVLGLSTDERS
jgi:hypothetical protein